MSICREDFSGNMAALIEARAAELGVPFSAAVRVVLQQGLIRMVQIDDETLARAPGKRYHLPSESIVGGTTGGNCLSVTTEQVSEPELVEVTSKQGAVASNSPTSEVSSLQPRKARKGREERVRRAWDPGFEPHLVHVPPGLDTPEFNAAWMLRIDERLALGSKSKMTKGSLESQLRMLADLAAAKGVHAATFCVKRATSGPTQGVVFTEDFDRTFPAPHQPSVAAKILADTPLPAPKKPTEKPGWEALKALDDHMWNTARAGGFPGFVGGKDQARFDTFAFGGKAAIKTVADLEILRDAFDQAMVDPRLWFSAPSMTAYVNPEACADGGMPRAGGGSTCPRCKGHREPSGAGGGMWVHFPIATQKSVTAPTQGGN
jgi:hypothetical protein